MPLNITKVICKHFDNMLLVDRRLDLSELKSYVYSGDTWKNQSLEVVMSYLTELTSDESLPDEARNLPTAKKPKTNNFN